MPVAFWIFKTAVVAASLGAVALAAHCADRLGRSPVVAVVVVGLNPVALIWGIGAQHNDSFMVLCILAAIALWLHSRDGWAAALLVVACAFKISALPLLPVFLIGAADRRAALKGAAIAFAAAVGGQPRRVRAASARLRDPVEDGQRAQHPQPVRLLDRHRRPDGRHADGDERDPVCWRSSSRAGACGAGPCG